MSLLTIKHTHKTQQIIGIKRELSLGLGLGVGVGLEERSGIF